VIYLKNEIRGKPKLGLSMSAQEFLDSLPSKATKKVYKSGLKKFFKWYGKTPLKTPS